jgi:site-specific DNA-methyltransferase (adenine-specific)
MNTVVYNCDCMEHMKDIPDKFYDLAIVDPPYGIGAGNVKRGGQQHGNALAPSKEYDKKEWDSMPPPKEYFDELFRVSKNQIIWGGNYYTLPVSSAWVFWDKVTGNNGYADGELAWTSFENALRMFRFEWHGMLQGNMKNKENRIHPTQKPVALYKWLLSRYAHPGDKIFDSHVGSGSSRIACYDMGFDYTGCELDKDYFDAEEKRFADHIVQGSLFQAKEIQGLIYKNRELL